MWGKLVRRLHVRSYEFYTFQTVRQLSASVQHDHIIGSSLPDIQIPNLTIPEFVSQKWSAYPNRTALECAVTGKKYTFEQLRRQSTNLGASLRKKFKLREGDVIAALLPNSPDYGLCILGALQAGLIVTTINPIYTVEEINRHLLDTEAKAIITFTPLVSTVQKCSVKIPVIATKINPADSLPSGVVLFDELIEDRGHDIDLPSVDPSNVAVMPSSSGTTGFPKAVELTHRNVVANVLQICFPEVEEVITSTDNYEAVATGILPFFHVAGLMPCLFTQLYSMSKLVTLPKFQPDTYIGLLENHKPHFHIVVPFIVSFFTNNPNVKRKHFDGTRVIGTSAASMSSRDEEMLLEKVGRHVDITQGYGITEATAMVTLRHLKNANSPANSGSVGNPLQNTFLKVVDDGGKTLGPNAPGELLIKGPQIMKGYFKKPQETKEAFVDGWLKTGDVGYYNENGVFYITDRLKELIKVKGFQVAPAELEAILREHPGVLEAAVIGVPHATDGEVPRAYVVLRENANAGREEIEKFVADKAAKFKQLKGGVVFVDSFPRAASGKIVRRKVKADFENKQP